MIHIVNEKSILNYCQIDSHLYFQFPICPQWSCYAKSCMQWLDYTVHSAHWSKFTWKCKDPPAGLLNSKCSLNVLVLCLLTHREITLLWTMLVVSLKLSWQIYGNLVDYINQIIPQIVLLVVDCKVYFRSPSSWQIMEKRRTIQNIKNNVCTWHSKSSMPQPKSTIPGSASTGTREYRVPLDQTISSLW